MPKAKTKPEGENLELQRMLTAARNEAIRETEEKYKRKVQEAFQCTVCISIPRAGHIMQCQNGHLICDKCTNANRSNTCPSCRAPLDTLAGNKRIRALAVEQLIETLEIPFPCKHEGCEFSDSKDETIEHEKKCEYRLVSCPTMRWCYTNQWPLRDLLGHINMHIYTQEAELIRTGEYSVTIKAIETVLSLHNLDLLSTVMKYERSVFLSVAVKTDGIFYVYTYILGDLKEAQKFKVAISIGKGGPSALIHVGQIFPIDARREDILKEKNGVLSFNPIGMGETFFGNVEGGKTLAIEIKIRKAEDLTRAEVFSN